jgi:hypothetical protein
LTIFRSETESSCSTFPPLLFLDLCHVIAIGVVVVDAEFSKDFACVFSDDVRRGFFELASEGAGEVETVRGGDAQLSATTRSSKAFDQRTEDNPIGYMRTSI